MPTFTFTSPDGKSYDITGPEGATKEQAFGILQTKLKGGAAAPESPAAAGKPPEAPSMLDQVGDKAREAVGAVAEPVMAMGSSMVAKPAGDVAGLAAIPLHAMGAIKTEPQDVQAKVRGALSYEPRTAAGKAVTEYNPLALVGKGIGYGADKLSSIGAPPNMGSMEGALRSGAREALTQAPAFLGLKAPEAAAAASGGLKTMARDTMQSALKPPIAAQRTGKSATAIDTLLDEGVNVTKGGADALRERVDALNSNIAQRIQTSTATIDKAAVTSDMQKLVDKFQKQVNPLDDVKAIQKAWDEFTNHPLLKGSTIPVKQAQEMKQATYRSLGDKSYGELKSADIEAQKTLARGLKDEIAKAVPEVRPLNAEESKLLTALPLVERRVLMEANKNPIGLGWLTADPMKFAGWMADRSGLFKSLVARMLNTASGAAPAVGAAGPGLGMAISNQAQPPVPALP